MDENAEALDSNAFDDCVVKCFAFDEDTGILLSSKLLRAGAIPAMNGHDSDNNKKEEQTRVPLQQVIRLENFKFCETLPIVEAVGLLDGSNDLTGVMLWPGSLLFSSWILQNKVLFKDRTVLELGSGAGLSGITLSHVCKQAILSDKHEDVVALIGENIKNNAPPERCLCRLLQWGSNVNELLQKFPDITVVVGCDIIYDSDSMGALWQTIDEVLNRGVRNSFASSASLLPVGTFCVMYDPAFDQAEAGLLQQAKLLHFEIKDHQKVENRIVIVFQKSYNNISSNFQFKNDTLT